MVDEVTELVADYGDELRVAVDRDRPDTVIVHRGSGPLVRVRQVGTLVGEDRWEWLSASIGFEPTLAAAVKAGLRAEGIRRSGS